MEGSCGAVRTKNKSVRGNFAAHQGMGTSEVVDSPEEGNLGARGGVVDTDSGLAVVDAGVFGMTARTIDRDL